MNIKKIYAATLARQNMDAGQFLTSLETAVNYLYSRYGNAIAQEGADAVTIPNTLDGDLCVDEIFFDTLVCYVIYDATGNEEKRSLAMVVGDFAYRTLWRNRAKGKRLRKDRW